MRNRGTVLIVIVIAALVGGGLWLWKGRGSDEPATSTVTQPGGSAKPIAAAPKQVVEPASIAVTVTDANGPLAGAVVRFAPDEGEVVVVETGADGVARADQLAPGTWAISASAAAHEPAALPPHALASGADAKLALVLAAGGRTLSGQVTDVSGGPIAGARIDAAKLAVMARPDRAVATALTGADGKYQLTVAEGQLIVAARSADYAAQSKVVEVGPAGATADFALVPGGVIEGVVRDERTREPVPGAMVEAQRDSAAIMLAESGARQVIAGADGKFRLGGLRPGVYELDAYSDARRTRSSTIVGLGVAEQVGDVEILVGAGAVIRGKVVDEQGAPIAKATVNALGERRGGAEATSEADGSFVLVGLNAGTYHLFGRSDGHVPARPTPVELVEQDVEGIVVTLRRGIRVKGHVEPRQIATVTLEPDDSELGRGMPSFLAPRTTGPDGEFELPPVLPGKSNLTARCPSGDHGAMPIEVKDGMAEVILKVTPGASIAGKVVDGEGKPVPNVTVTANPQDGGTRMTIVNGVITSGVQALTNAAGGYEVRGLAAGSYRMSALDRGRAVRLRSKPPNVTLAAADRKTGVDLAIDRPNGVIKGVVTGPDGKPQADAWVSVHLDFHAMIEQMASERGEGESRMMRVEQTSDGEGGASGDFPPALTDAQGRFEITGLPHATYEVLAEAQAGKLRGRASRVTPDASITLQIAGVTSLAGTVNGPSGPAALFTVELDGPTRAQRTFTDGKFEIGRVDPGTYTVRVTSKDGNAEVQVEVAQGKPTTVDIALAANAIVIGSIVDGAGKPVPGVPVTVIDDSGDGQISVRIEGPPPTTGPDGKFRVERKAGKGILVVLGGPRPVTKRGLVLVAGKTIDVGAVNMEAPESPE